MFTQIVTQTSLLKGAIPGAGQTFHQGLILAFISQPDFLLCSSGLGFFCLFVSVFIVGCLARSLFLLFVCSGTVWFLLRECLGLEQEQGRGAGGARGSVSSCCRGGMCQASAFSGFLSPFSSVLLQGRQDSLRAVCAVPAAWCSLGDLVVTARLRLSPPRCPLSQGCRGAESSAGRGDTNGAARLRETLAGTSMAWGLFTSPLQSSRKSLQTAAGSHPFDILTTG